MAGKQKRILSYCRTRNAAAACPSVEFPRAAVSSEARCPHDCHGYCTALGSRAGGAAYGGADRVAYGAH
eukprot:1503639-Prymnesium_polylepis.1